jgi:hypothetical protein
MVAGRTSRSIQPPNQFGLVAAEVLLAMDRGLQHEHGVVDECEVA